MRSFELKLPAETAESVEVEADLLGFDSPDSYVRWVVSRRFAIDDGSDLAATLDEYAGRADDATPSREEPDSTDGGPADEARANDRSVDRIEDRSLDDAAAALSSVETSRVDAFARRALSQTREQLGDDVETGIDYTARTRVEDAPLGAEITDLDAIELPGHDEELVARRRVAVGAALAFLKDAESARRSDFVDALYEDYPAGYETVDSWWNCLKRGLRQVDRVKPADENSRVWGFRTTPGRIRRISYS